LKHIQDTGYKVKAKTKNHLELHSNGQSQDI